MDPCASPLLSEWPYARSFLPNFGALSHSSQAFSRGQGHRHENVLDMEQEMGGVAREAFKSLEKKGNKRAKRQTFTRCGTVESPVFLACFLRRLPFARTERGGKKTAGRRYALVRADPL